MFSVATAQISERVSRVSTGVPQSGEPLFIQADLVQPDIIERLELAYRQFGESNYRFVEMSVIGNTATGTIPANSISPPLVEYYFILHLYSVALAETYPLENAEQHPLRIDVQSSIGPHGIVLLSPEEGEPLRPEDVLISFSLINFDSTLDRSNLKIFVDNADLSTLAIVSGDLVVLRADNISAGNHTFKIELFNQQGQPLEIFSRGLTLTSFGIQNKSTEQSPWLYSSSVQLETRHENISDVATPFNRATVSASGRYENFRIHGRMYVTDEEKENRQPQDRFFIGGESPWLSLGYGDSYPIFPDLIMNGKRVRGFAGNLTLGGFNLDITKGDIVRPIESDIIAVFPQDSLPAQQNRDPYGSYGLYDPQTQQWAKFLYGTFSRDIFIVRPSFGRRNESHIGFTYLKSKDDVSSVRFGGKPQENIVLGSDLLLTFDDRRIEFSGQAAVSATNRDITKGTFSDADIDTVFKDYSAGSRDNIKTIRDIVSRFITVNENLVPLNEKHLPTLSYETNILLNYFNNNLKLTFLRHGDTYESFGQSFLRTDVDGFNISDRVRLIENQLFLSGGFEHLEDNTAKTKASTTTGTTVNVGASYYPRLDAPSITVAYLHASNTNDRSISDSLYAVEDQTDRVLLQLGKEFTFGEHHSASLSLSTSTRDDHTFRDFDTRNTSVTLSNTTRFSIPLQTLFTLSFNSSKFITVDSAAGKQSTTLSYMTLHANAQYRMIEDRLRVNGSLSPTFGDIERILVNANVQYYFLKNISAQTDLTLYFNSKLFNTIITTNDVIWSVILRADF